MGTVLGYLPKDIEFQNTNSHGGYGRGGGYLQPIGGHSNAGYQNALDVPQVDPEWVNDPHDQPGMRNTINMVPGEHIPFKSRFRKFLESRRKKDHGHCCDECAEKAKEKNFNNCCGQ